MKTGRMISVVRSMLERSLSFEEMVRLTNLLVMLQKDRIIELEKELAPINRRYG